MKQTSDERKLLNQIAEAREDLKGFGQRKISHLLHELDTVEQGVKSVGAVGKNTKAAYKKFHADLGVIKTKIMKLRAGRHVQFIRGARVIALVMATLFLFLYVFAGFNRKIVSTNIGDLAVWCGIGIAASALTYLIFMVNFDIYISLAIRLPGRYNPGKPTLLERLYGVVIYYLLIFAYFNTYVLLFSFTQSWAYPFLRSLIDGILQGETLPVIYAFLTVVIIIIELIASILSIADFFEKRRHKNKKIL